MIPVSTLAPISRSGVDDRRFLSRLILIAWLLRLAVVVLFNLTGAVSELGLSSDSFLYHRAGTGIARNLAGGASLTDLQWVDNGWFQFTGLVYYLLSPNPVWIQLINITLSTLAVWFAYTLTLRGFGHRNAARLTAAMVAVFPSFVYWSTMMLKDPAALLAMTMITCSLVCLRQRFEFKWLLALIFGLMVYLGIRQYMFLVCLVMIPLALIPFSQRRLGATIFSTILSIAAISVITSFMGYGFLGFGEIGQSHYFDLEYINQTRINIGDHGSGAIYVNPEDALWGSDWIRNINNAFTAVFYFFVSIDLTEIRSLRQLMALPEVLVFISILPSLFKGMLLTWKRCRRTAWPILLMASVVLVVYSSATTNLGALFRWRMQSMPMFMAMAAMGVALYHQSWLYRFAYKLGIFK